MDIDKNRKTADPAEAASAAGHREVPVSGRILSQKMGDFAENCCQGDRAPCRASCPFDMDIISLVSKIQKSNFRSAYNILKDSVVFPNIVSKLCEQPCRDVCVRKEIDGCIDLKKLERAVVEFSGEKKSVRYSMPKKEQKIAVVGAGLAGLACTVKLVFNGYDVTVFEKSFSIGGSLHNALPEEEFLPELHLQTQHLDFDLITNREIYSLDELQTFDAVLVATGKGGNCFSVLDTDKTGVFIAGEVLGTNGVEAIEAGVRASRLIEAFLKTGRMPECGGQEAGGRTVKEPSRLQVNLNRVKPAANRTNSDVYTKEEAIVEAGLCIKCDCSECSLFCDFMQHYKKMPKKIVDDVRINFNPIEGLQARVATRMIASCSACGLCSQVCHEDIDLGEFLLEARSIMHREGSLPKAFHDFWMKDMEFSQSDEAWLAGNSPGGENCQALFFPGCQLGGSDVRYVELTYEYLLQKNPQTGLLLGCCGVPAKWAGDEKYFEELLKKIKSHWKLMGKPRIILSCPSCIKTFKTHLAEIETISIYEFMEAAGDKPVLIPDQSLSVFDPCASRTSPEMQGSVRNLLMAGMKRIRGEAAEVHVTDRDAEAPDKIILEELPYGGGTAKCCSFGGHIQQANPDLAEKIVLSRTEQSELPYVTYCINCRDIFSKKGKQCRHVLDFMLGINAEGYSPPTLSERRENRRRLKRSLIEKYWPEKMDEAGGPHDKGENEKMKLLIPDKVRERMEKLYILEEDVRDVILHCETTGRKMYNPEKGCLIGSHRKDLFTYWVHYSLKGSNEATIINAYCHKMCID